MKKLKKQKPCRTLLDPVPLIHFDMLFWIFGGEVAGNCVGELVILDLEGAVKLTGNRGATSNGR